MRWFANLPICTKLLISFGLMVALLALVTSIACLALTAMQKSQRDLYEHEFTIAVDLEELRSNQNATQAALLTMMLLRERAVQEAQHQEIKSRLQENAGIMQELLSADRQEQALLRRLEEFAAIRGAAQQVREMQTIPLVYAGKIDEVQGLFLGIQAKRDDKMRALADELVEAAKESAWTAIMQSERAAQRAVQISMVVSVLAQTFRDMVERLREVTREMREGVNVLASVASEILAAKTQVASGAAQTAAAVSETTITVEEVKQTAAVSSQKAKVVSESAGKAAQISQTGRKSVEEAIDSMRHTQDQMEAIAASIVRLSEQSQAIGEIIATVNDLADQFNLLAVNAAIEAAKAGEQGKGFAVVAQEVRSLAESAQAATQIAPSSQQQLVGMDQVAMAMENINQASAQNVGGTRQVETAAQGLRDLGQTLQQLVDQYKL